MNKPARALSLIVLVATLLVAGIAAMPAQLAPPSQPTVIATANAGRVSGQLESGCRSAALHRGLRQPG